MRVANNLVMNNQLPIQDQITILQRKVDQLFHLAQGRVSFGTGVDGVSGQNIEGEWQIYTSNSTPDTEDMLSHTIGSIPLGYLVVNQNKAGTVYGTASLGTAWTSSNIYLKCNVASVTFLLFLVKKGAVN